jgi:hypothetical protein
MPHGYNLNAAKLLQTQKMSTLDEVLNVGNEVQVRFCMSTKETKVST